MLFKLNLNFYLCKQIKNQKIQINDAKFDRRKCRKSLETFK